MTAQRYVLLHGGGNFKLAAETRKREIESLAELTGEPVEVDLLRVSTPLQVRNALLFGQTSAGHPSARKPAPSALDFFTHSGPHGIYLSAGYGQNIAFGRTVLSENGVELASTPYREVMANLTPKTLINVHGCKFGRAMHGRQPGAQEMADALGTAVSASTNPRGTLFTQDLNVALGLRKPTIQEIKTPHFDRSKPMWMFPEPPGTSGTYTVGSPHLKTFWPASSAQMWPGTEYSDLRTGASYRVDASGRHVQTGSFGRMFADARAISPSQHLRDRYDPVRAAARALGA